MRKILFIMLLMFSDATLAGPAIYKVVADKPVSALYDHVKSALEEERLFVVFEPDIGRNISGFKEKWGDNYNRNHLDEIRSLVFCNAWFANEVSNKDPDMLGLCPLKITLTEKDGKTTALFVLPTQISGQSPATEVLSEIEGKVKSVLKKSGFK